MSLNFKLVDIADYESLCYDDGEITAECHNMIFATISAGIGRITEKNYIEFALRVNLAGGLSEFQSDWMVNLKPETVRKYIGLTTNVGDESFSKWVKGAFERATQTASYKERQRLSED